MEIIKIPRSLYIKIVFLSKKHDFTTARIIFDVKRSQGNFTFPNALLEFQTKKRQRGNNVKKIGERRRKTNKVRFYCAQTFSWIT